MKDIRRYENAHIVLWLIKDCCWVLDCHWGGVSLILPTILVAIHIAYRSRHNRDDMMHNIAVCCWIAANATWMTGEFFFSDSWRPYATVFFALGMLTLASHYLPKLRHVIAAK